MKKVLHLFLVGLVSVSFVVAVPPLKMLCQAMADNNLSGVDEYIQQGGDLDVQDANGITPLMAAIALDNKDMLEGLLTRGANPNQVGWFSAPLHWAAVRGKEELVNMLLTYGANVQLQDVYKKTAAECAREKGFHEIADMLFKREINPRF